MTAVTDALHRLFVRDENLVRQARGFGMNLTQRLTPLKHWLISRAMGTAGDVPQMVKPRASGSSSAP
jgi:2-polyprenyl-6-methoxyphenol hydroxylase-like FAD-dependent oxidoreductase